jgi:hypothetical protein
MMNAAVTNFDQDFLRISRWVVLGCMAFLWVGIAAIALALPVLFFARGDMLVHMGRDGIAVGATEFYAMVAIGLMGMALLVYLGTRFLVRLLAFIRSVDAGDPFARANADRFHAMAWLMLAMEAIGVSLHIYGQWLGSYSKDIDFGFGLSVSGLIAVLLLFVLARVFAHGAAMRDDLEGTV